MSSDGDITGQVMRQFSNVKNKETRMRADLDLLHQNWVRVGHLQHYEGETADVRDHVIVPGSHLHLSIVLTSLLKIFKSTQQESNSNENWEEM